MSKIGKLNEDEIATLRKSLTDLGFDDAKTEQLIQKAIKEDEKKDEDGKSGEQTMEEKAAAGKENSKETGGEDKDKDEEEAEAESKHEEAKKEYEIMKCRMDELKKSYPDLGTSGDNLQKSLTDNIRKSIEDELTESISGKFTDIIKGLSDELSVVKHDNAEIIKGLQEEVQKIGSTAIPMKSVLHNVNFFEKSLNSDINAEEGSSPNALSISKNKDELLKSMQDTMEKESDPIMKEMLLDGISDYSINSTPNTHGVRALTYISRKNNITLLQ